MTTTAAKRKSAKLTEPSEEILRRIFERMVLSRSLEILIARHIRDHGFAGWWHPGLGQEGAGVGATVALRPDDYLWYQGRGVATSIGKGMGPEAIFLDLLGRAGGPANGKGAGVPHWSDPSIGVMGEGATLGSAFPLAAGAALAAQMRGTDQVSVADFGDGTSARGTFHETLISAATWKLPLIYFCQNNGISVSTTFESQHPTPNVADRAVGYGIPGRVVDGSDAVAVYQAVSGAIERARNGDGPSIVEAKVRRLGGHWEGDVKQYRDEDEYLKSYRDPLVVMRERLSEAVASEIETSANARIQSAYEAALAAPKPSPSVIFEDVFA